jgi:hypothetical protein
MVALTKPLLGLNSVGANQMILQRGGEKERSGDQYGVRDTAHG